MFSPTIRHDFQPLPMKLGILAAMVLAGILALGNPARAAVVLSLNQTSGTSASSVTSANIGEVLGFEVVLGGLGTGETLDFLSAQVFIDVNYFDPPPSVDAGAIVPDPTGFAAAIFPTDFTADYDVLFAASGLPISSNGVFFTFSLTVHQVIDDTLSPVPPTGGVLDSVPTVNAIPEPSSLAIYSLMLGTLGLVRLCRRRRQSLA